MRRFKFILIPFFTILGLVGGVRPAHAVDWGDIFGAALGFFIGGPLGAIFGAFGGLDWVGDVGGRAASFLVIAVIWVINTVLTLLGTILFFLANGLVSLAIEINATITDSSVVREGFGIVLNVANLGLIVAIVAIAFMVMLRRPGATKLLPRFIAVALLINFSFLIVTNFLLEPVNQITEVLRQAANFDPNSFSQVFVPNIDWGNAIEDVFYQANLDDTSGWVTEASIALLGVFFYVTFLIIGAISLVAFAGMLFVRYIALSLLLILMPIAWVAWIFPNLKIPGGNPASVWWESFTRWLLFAPISMFFFFLAIRATTAGDILVPVTGANPIVQLGSAVGNMVVVIGFMLGGLVIANKMSITGASYALGVTKKLGKYARDKGSAKLKSEVAKGTVRALNAKPVKKKLENLSSAGSGSDSRTIRTLGAIPRALGRTSMDAAQRGENYVKEQAKKRYQNYAPYRLKELLKNKNLSDIERVAIQSAMDSKDSTWETNIGEHLGDFYERGVVAKTGSQKEQIGWIKEGLDPRVAAAIDRGESEEAIGALMRTRYDTEEDKHVIGIGKSILADYDPETKHYGMTPKQHAARKKAFLNYFTQDRAQVLTKVRGKQTRSGKANLNKAAQEQLHTGLANTILKQDKNKRGKFVSDHWEGPKGIMEAEIARRVDAIDAVIDSKWEKGFDDKGNPLDRELEKIRIRKHVESLGAEGFLGELHALDNSQKDMYSALLEGTGADAGTDTTTTDST